MAVDIPTLVSVAAVTSGAVAAGLSFSIRSDIAARVGASLRIWAVSVSIQAVGWLFAGFRGSVPDGVSVVAGNVCIALGYAEGVRALRLFGGRPFPRWAYVPPLAVLLASLTFTYLHPSRDLRMLANSAIIGLLLAGICVEVIRLEPHWREQPRSHRLLLTTYAVGATLLFARVIWLAVTGSAEAVVPVTVVILYASCALGPVVGTLAFALMCADRLDRELAFLASADPLTGVFNRRTLEKRAEHEIVQATRHRHPVVLAVIDVDRFKSINDEKGHAAGDEALKRVTQIMLRELRKADTLSRIGGDEFAIVLPYCDLAAGLQAGARIADAVRTAAGGESTLTVSIGVAEWQRGETLDELFRRADAALYRAKAAGRDRVEG